MSKHIWASANVNVKYYYFVVFGAVVIYLLHLTYATINVSTSKLLVKNLAGRLMHTSFSQAAD
jgi:uncharacterized membrane protein YdfJ with MMPL/SSD domain